MKEVLNQLQTHEVLNALTEIELASLAPIIHTKSYEEGATVFDVGQDGVNFPSFFSQI